MHKLLAFRHVLASGPLHASCTPGLLYQEAVFEAEAMPLQGSWILKGSLVTMYLQTVHLALVRKPLTTNW